MATVEQLQISYSSDVAVKATADKAALEGMAAGAEKAGKAVDTVDQAIKRATPSMEAIAAKTDGATAAATRLEAATRKFQASVDSVNAAQAKGNLTATEAAATIQRLTVIRDQDAAKAAEYGQKIEQRFAPATAATNQLATSSKAVSFAMRDLGLQSIDAFQGLATGQPIFRTLIQQGAQVAQVNAAMGVGFRAMATEMGSVITRVAPFLGIGAAVAVVGGTIAVMASHLADVANETRQIDTALKSVGLSAERSAESLQKYVSTLAQGGVSRGDATSIVSTLARNAALSGTQIGQIAKLTPDTATALGVDPAAAAKALGDAAGGSYAAIQKLDDSLNFLTRDELTNIRTMLQHGDRAGAVSVAMDELRKHTDGLREQSLGPFQKAWEEIGKAYNATIDSMTNRKIPAFSEIEANALPFAHVMSTTVPSAPNHAQAEAFSAQQGVLDQERQQKAVDAVTKSFDEQNRVLAAGLPTRALVQAQITASNTIRDKELTGDQALAVTKATVRAASIAAGDAAVQEASAIQRQISGTVVQTRALGESQAAEIVAIAAIEAHEKAATQAGVSEMAYAAAIINRNAATEAKGVGKQADDLSHQADAAERAAKATSLQEVYQTDLNNKIEAATRASRAYEEVATDPRVLSELVARRVEFETWTKRQDAAAVKERENRQFLQGGDLIADLRMQMQLIGGSADQVERELAGFREMQKLISQDGANPNSLTEQQQKLIDQAKETASLQLTLRDRQQSLQAVTDALGNAFDQLGSSMVNAFLSGQGSAVNFANAIKGIVASLATEFAKLALLNPLLNELVPSSSGARPTLSAALGGSSGISGFGGGIGGLYQAGSAASSVSGAFGGPTITSSLGLGEGGYFSGATSAVRGYLASPVLGSGTIGSAVGPGQTAFLNSAGVNTGAAAPGLSVGSALGGIGAGYTVGSLAGGYVQGAMNKTGPGPQIGAGIGAAGLVAAAALAPETFGLSLLVAGLLGGTAGGIAGGLIGPHPASPFSLTNVGVDQAGKLRTGSSANQLSGSNESEVKAGVDQFNQILTVAGIRIANVAAGAGLGSVGTEPKNPLHTGTNWSAASLGDLFPKLTYASDSPHMNAYLQANGGAGFGSTDEMIKVLAAVQGFVNLVGSTDFAAKIDGVLSTAEAMGAEGGPNFLASVATFVTQTVPAMTDFGTVTGSLNDAVKALVDTYAPAITMAQQLGYKEQELTDARDKSIRAAITLATEQTRLTDASFVGRYFTARAANDKSPGEAQMAALYNFDLQADAQRKSFLDGLVTTYGDAYKDTQQYVDQSTYLEQALGEERLAVQNQYNNTITDAAKQAADEAAQAISQAAGTAGSTVVQISDYIKKFSSGSASPLSANSQFDIASRQFDSVANSAIGGNFAASQQFTTYADSLATSARTVYGSGAGYAAVVDRIVTAANQIASQGSDMLTASVQRAEIRTQTQILGEKLDTLTAEVTLLRQQTQQAANIPARAA